MDGTWCPQCGPFVKIDEDGCCATCGATATGPGADQALAALQTGMRTVTTCRGCGMEMEVSGPPGDYLCGPCAEERA